MRTHRLAAILAFACACIPATAQAAQSVSLDATLTPERLGQGTTIGFAFQIAAPAGQVPPPLTGLDLRYPDNLGIALSGLGLATCSAEALQVSGPPGCPADSLMGYGSARAEISVGPAIVHETAGITIVRAPTEDGHLALLIHVSGLSPVLAQIAFPAFLLPSAPPFGGHLQIDIPLVPSFPESPDVAVVRLRATLGPQGITYYERSGNRVVAYRPKGILLPDICPRGGFPFAAEFKFQNGSHANARTAVPCPHRATTVLTKRSRT